MNKVKINMLGYFILVPGIFIISSFIWRLFVLKRELWVVTIDCFSILGVYYFIASLITIIIMNKKSKED